MKRSRLLLLVSAAVVAGLIGAVVVVFTASFQTWVVRRYLADLPGLKVSVGEVSADLSHVRVSDLRVAFDGGVATIPRLEANLPLFAAAWDRRLQISRLEARGWTVDCDRATATKPSGPGAAPAPTSTAKVPGFLAPLTLPVDVALDGVQLSGVIVLPEGRGRMNVSITGGGLSVGREGRFAINAAAELKDPAFDQVRGEGRVSLAMDTPRTLQRVAAEVDLTAKGTRAPAGVALKAVASTSRKAGAESYSLAVISEGRDLVRLGAERGTAERLTGKWSVELRQTDLVPFALGFPLPEFTAAGEGDFESELGSSALAAAGRLQIVAAGLHVFRPELKAVGTLALAADFSLATRDGVVGVRTLDLSLQSLAGAANRSVPTQLLAAKVPVGGGRAVATIRALQPFDFAPEKGTWVAADPTKDLLAVTLAGLPLAWLQPWVPSLEFTGGDLRGALALAPRARGATLRSTAPLTVAGVTWSRAGQPQLKDLSLALTSTADLTPQGWQAEIGRLTVTSDTTELLSLSAKAGQLAGANQPVKATGQMAVNLPGVLAQPLLAGQVALATGEATARFVVSLGSKTELQTDLAVTKLAARDRSQLVPLPALTAAVRADFASDGTVVVNAPVVLERDERKSDLTLAGTLKWNRGPSQSVDAEITSNFLVWDDARSLGALAPQNGAEAPANAPGPHPAPPPWAGLNGKIALRLKQVVYSDTVSVSNLTGRLSLDAGTVQLEGLQAGLGEGGQAQVSGTLTYDDRRPQPYALAADVAVKEFDPAPLFRAVGSDQPATVEGKFDLTTRVTSSAPTLGKLAEGAGGSLQLTSKGGVFRGLPVNVKTIAETTGKFAALLAQAGTAISAMAGRKDYADVPNRAQAVAELVKGLNPIQFDQLSVVMSRDEKLTTTLRDFTLISPEVRLQGGGTATHRPGACLLEDALDMEFTLRVRGRQGDLLKYLGALEAQPDDLGYAACTVPLKVSGSVARPDTSDLNNRLTSLAIEKSGLSEFATELLNRIRGGK